MTKTKQRSGGLEPQLALALDYAAAMVLYVSGNEGPLDDETERRAARACGVDPDRLGALLNIAMVPNMSPLDVLIGAYGVEAARAELRAYDEAIASRPPEDD